MTVFRKFLENQINRSPNFLDLNINIQNLYFKQNFTINETIPILIWILFKSYNISHKMFHSAMSAEILRIYKTTTKFQDFIKFAKILLGKIIKQGGLINYMKALFKQFSSHEECFIKFGTTDDYILNKLL